MAFTRTPIVVALVVFLPLLAQAASTLPFRVCEDSTQQIVAGGDRSEVQMVYNPHRREYFAVHLFHEGEQTSVVGQRFNERGVPINGLVMIAPAGTDPTVVHKKQYPVVAYSNVTDNYLVVWEYDFSGEGKDWDIVARMVSGTGQLIGSVPFFVSASFGREDSPHVAFSYKDNNFVVVHEVESGRDRGISVQRLNDTHYIGNAIVLNTTYADREPFVAYHPPSNDFAVVWEWDQNNDNKSVIGAVMVGGLPIVARNTQPNIVGSTVEIIGDVRTVAHDHDASLVWSSKDNNFLLTWEVDGDSGDKEVVCSLITADGKSTRHFKVVGNASHPYDRHPSAVYSPYSDEFFILYETGLNARSSGIEGVAFRSKDLTMDGEPFAVSQMLNKEHLPAAALSTTCGSIFAIWASDTTQAQAPHRRSSSSDVDPPTADPTKGNKPTSRFAPTTDDEHDHEAMKQMKKSMNDGKDLTVKSYAARSKFESALGRRAAGEENVAVPHIYMTDNLPVKRIDTAASTQEDERVPPSTYSLQSLRVCLPGRGSCSAAGTPLPVPSHKPIKPHVKGHDGGSNAAGVVVGLLVAVVVLAGMGAGGYVGWQRRDQIREWWETRRSGSGSTAMGVWADESEFSISVDAFSNDDSSHTNDDH